MERRAWLTVWGGLIFMVSAAACAAPLARLWSLTADWERSDILALLQTIFSILALAAALAIAGYEVWRATRGAAQQRSAVVSVARDIIDRALRTIEFFAALDAALGETPRDALLFRQILDLAIEEVRTAEKAIEVLSAQALPDTSLFLALTRMRVILRGGLALNAAIGLSRETAFAQRAEAVLSARLFMETIRAGLKAIE